MPVKDNAPSENSKENLERRLDHAIEETFPDSDPVSVSVTKGGATDYDHQGAAASARLEGSDQEGRSAAENRLGQAKETIRNAADSASEAAREAYAQGRRYAAAAGERYPEAERYYRESTQAVRQRAAENPLMTLLVGIGIGYALAWMIHSGGSARGERLPDYARTRHGYAPHRAQPRG